MAAFEKGGNLLWPRAYGTHGLPCWSAGDAETWSSYTQNVLCACHSRVDIAYLGMDDSALAASAKAALDPAAQPLTAPSPDLNLAQHSMAGQRSRSGGQSVHSLAAVEAALGQLAGFLDALERLLTVSFPVAVPMPAHGILMLLTRILLFDDSVRQAGKFADGTLIVTLTLSESSSLTQWSPPLVSSNEAASKQIGSMNICLVMSAIPPNMYRHLAAADTQTCSNLSPLTHVCSYTSASLISVCHGAQLLQGLGLTTLGCHL